jgi:hypothetical protein
MCLKPPTIGCHLAACNANLRKLWRYWVWGALPALVSRVAYPGARPRAPGAPALALGALFDRHFSMFKMPAYDPFSIVVMGAGVLLAAKLAVSF